MSKRDKYVSYKPIQLGRVMKKGLTSFLSLYFLLGILIFILPSNIIYAQDDTVEEIFWGDDEEDEGLEPLTIYEAAKRWKDDILTENGWKSGTETFYETPLRVLSTEEKPKDNKKSNKMSKAQKRHMRKSN